MKDNRPSVYFYSNGEHNYLFVYAPLNLNEYSMRGFVFDINKNELVFTYHENLPGSYARESFNVKTQIEELPCQTIIGLYREWKEPLEKGGDMPKRKRKENKAKKAAKKKKPAKKKKRK